MGIFRTDNNSESGTATFEPVATNGTMVLGYFDDPGEDGKRLVWVNGKDFEKIDISDIDRVVG